MSDELINPEPKDPKKKTAKQVYKEIWEEFARDRQNNRAQAYTRLQQNFAKNADVLVPGYATAKEHMAMIGDIEQYTKGDQQSASGDPREIVGAWLRGEEDISRVPLGKVQ